MISEKSTKSQCTLEGTLQAYDYVQCLCFVVTFLFHYAQ